MKTKSTLFCLVFAVCVNIHTAKAQVNVQDSLALVDLYNSTHGVIWYDHTNWLTSKPVSTWYGITVTNTRVTVIYMGYNNLNGSIPSSIGNLVNLQTVWLNNNQLSGSIPSSIGNLVNLTQLTLQNNQLSGNIPSSLGNLVNLHQQLRLDYNQLSGSIPSSIGNLVNLEQLLLNNNQLSGSIPASLGNLVNLGTLGLGQNKLNSTIPSSIGNLVHLGVLDLSFNQLSGSIPSSIGNLVKLLYLYLNNNQLSGSIPSSIGNCVYLNSILDLSYNQLSGSIPSTIGNLQILGALDLSNNQLSGNIPSSLGNLGSLSDLDLSSNQLSDSIPSSLGNLGNLYYLNLSYNQLSGSIPSSLGNIKELYNLDLSFNQLSGTIPPFYVYYYLHLDHNPFTFDGMELIAKTFPFAIYDHQARIPVHQNGNALSVSAGGTLSNNTYEWFYLGKKLKRKEGQKEHSTIIHADSVFDAKKEGMYFLKVTNSIATQLVLQSDTIYYDKHPKAVIASSQQNALQQYSKTNAFRVYPNPAKDVLHVETNGNASFSLLNQSGKILLTANINGKGSINVSGMAAGLYYLKNNSTQAVQKVIIAR